MNKDKSYDSYPLWVDKLLERRNITVADCHTSLNSMLDPKDLYGIDKAVAVLVESLEKNHPIALAGDYDVDGATGVALAQDALSKFGCKATHSLLPDRFSGGYGLQPQMVEAAHNLGAKTLITVDNGISAIESVALAKKFGMSVIITDHHLPGETLPDADAIVNPNMPECQFSSKHLAGVGVIFYLMCALRTKLRELNWFLFNRINEPRMDNLLDLVALGTVADMALIDNNNRLLIKEGLKKIQKGQSRKGVTALLEAMNADPRFCSSRDIGFSLAPPLNAAGRLYHMDSAMNCLNARTWQEARETAAELVAHNVQRKQWQNTMFSEAMEVVTPDKPQVLFNRTWHQGLTGLLAGMVKDKVNQSCFVVAEAGDTYVGSGRAKDGDHLLSWLTTINKNKPGLLQRFGGHAKAAGFTLNKDSFDEFSEAALSCYNPDSYTDDDKEDINDGELPIEEITLENALLLEQLTPWGKGCPEPLFTSTMVLNSAQVIGQHHLRLSLSADGKKKVFNGVIFYHSMDEFPETYPFEVKIDYHLGVNRFRGKVNLQLVIEKITPLY